MTVGDASSASAGQAKDPSKQSVRMELLEKALRQAYGSDWLDTSSGDDNVILTMLSCHYLQDLAQINTTCHAATADCASSASHVVRSADFLRHAHADCFSCAVGPSKESWTSMVLVIAAASSQEVKRLIKQLNQGAAKLAAARGQHAGASEILDQIATDMDSVLRLPGAAHALAGPTGQTATLESVVRDAQNRNPHWTDRGMLDAVENIKAWRNEILTSFDGSGQLLTLHNGLMRFSEEGLPVRILVNDAFQADCLDSNDLVELFLCCEADDIVLQPGATVSMVR